MLPTSTIGRRGGTASSNLAARLVCPGRAVLAAGALVASLLAAGAGPAAAQSISAAPNHNPDFTPNWSVCVGAAGAHDAMFTDVSDDSAHAGAIDCIAYYGISVGKGDGTYAPNANVSAFEMRLFVMRAADLMGADGEAVLADVGRLSDPVTRLDMAKLMFGLVDDIDDGVRINPKSDQVEFLDNSVWRVVGDYFADALASVPIADSQRIGATYELGITRGTWGTGTRVGTLVSTPNSRFLPYGWVTRAQMASFIVRTLDHSNLRPEGLSIQRNNEIPKRMTMASLRDAAFRPVEGASIDVFSALYDVDAFDDDGECESRFVKDEAPSHSTCAIDIGDLRTDDEGNVEFELVSDKDPITAACSVGSGDLVAFTTAEGSRGRTFWAWTGERGDEVDGDTALSELEDVDRPVGATGPDYARVSGGLPTDDELAKMGETVTFKVQLYADAGTDRDTEKLVDDVAVGPDRSRNPYALRVEKFYVRPALWDHDSGTSTPMVPTDSDFGDAGETKTGSASTGTDSFLEAPGDWDYADMTGNKVSTAADALFQTPVDAGVFPNAAGEFTITLTHPDPRASIDNTDVAVRFTLTPFTAGNDLVDGNLVKSVVADGNYVGVTAVAGVGDVASGYVIFSDDRPDPHKVTGSSLPYRIISGSRTGNSVSVKVVDQYGDPMRSVKISVSSNLDRLNPDNDEVTYPEQVDITVQEGENNADGTGTDTDTVGTFPTRRSGNYRLGYYYTGTAAKTEKITPESIEIRGDDPDTANVETNAVIRAREEGDPVDVYWAKVGTIRSSPGVPLLVGDVANRTIVAGSSDAPMAYFYDEYDSFIVSNVGATFEMFEEALRLSIDAGDECEADTVMWRNYRFSRPGSVSRTIWELTLRST